MPDTTLDAVHQHLISRHAQLGGALSVRIILIKPIMQPYYLEDCGHSPGQRLVRTAVGDENTFYRRQDTRSKIHR